MDSEDSWVTLGSVDNHPLAEMARETLSTQDIPAVVVSRDGYFGNVGLNLNPFFKTGGPRFLLSVPAALLDDAIEVMNMTLGDNWIEGDA